MRLDFKPEHNAGVMIDLQNGGEYTSNVIKVEEGVADATVSFYLSIDAVQGTDTKVIKWEELAESTVVDVSFTYGNQSTSEERRVGKEL